MMSFIEMLEGLNKNSDTSVLWKGSFREFLSKFEEDKENNANIGVLAHQRVYNMILAAGTKEEDYFGKERISYPFFENTLFGIEDSIDEIMSYFHSAAQKTETSRRMLLLYGPPSSGKCLSGDTKIYDCTTGQLVRIDDIVENGRRVTVCAFDNNGKATIQGIRGRQSNGVKTTYRLKTSLGREIKATANHKFLTYDGWKMVGELSEKDRIVIPRILPEPMKVVSHPVDEIRFCAYIIGEGNCVSHVSFTNVEHVIRKEFISDSISLSASLCPSVPVCVKEDGSSLRVVKSVRNNHIANPLKVWLNENNLWGKLAIRKQCPSFVFQLPNNQLGMFLGRLYSCDGYIGRNTINYCSSSRKLAEDMTTLLSRFGIVSKLCYKNVQYHNKRDKVKVFDSWQVDISDSCSVENFGNNVAPYLIGNRQNQWNSFWEEFSAKKHREVMDTFPPDRESRTYFPRTDRNVSNRKLSAVAEKINSDKLMSLVNSDICYDKIVSIEVDKKTKVYDIEVPRFHNFVANNIVTHNSDLVQHLKKGLEAYTRTSEGAIYALAGSKMHENPFLLVPESIRSNFEKKYGLRIEGKLSPSAAYRLKEEFNGKFMDYPVEQIFIDEASRVGIGTWLPQDPKSSDQSELVGSIDFSKIQEYGDEGDPRAYNFNGELNVANRGVMEFIEGLKADERFLRVLLTATQEKSIKAPRFGLIYCDTVIILHSVHPDELIPIKEKGIIKLVQISSLLDPESLDKATKEFHKDPIQVLSIDERTRQPIWADVKRVHCHKYKGEVLQLQQKYGDILVSPNHSVYNQDFGLFDAKKYSENELLTVPYVPQENVIDSIILTESCKGLYIHDQFVSKETEKQATTRSSILNEISSEKMLSLLRIMAAYITEGHLLGPVNAPTGLSISQENSAWIQSLKTDFEILSDGVKSYINDRREDAENQTSRLEIDSVSWAYVIEQLCGHSSCAKKIPNFVFNLSYDMKMLFLNSLCFRQEMSENYLEKYFSYSTASRQLAAGFCLLCKMCGISVSLHRSKTGIGKIVYYITYVCRPQSRNIRTADRIDFNGYLYDIEVDTPYAHNFVCGVGGVVCHNTNEEEFRDFMSEKKYEAYHDRMIIIRVPYNMAVSNEVKIYKKLLSGSDAVKNMHIAPRTLEAAAMFAVLTRLSPPPEGGDLTLVKKMKLYDKQHVKGYKIEQVPDLKKKDAKEGMSGLSPRFIIDQISVAIANAKRKNKNYITALDVLRQLNNGVSKRDSFTKAQKNHYEALIEEAREEWDDMLRDDIQKAFFVSYETEARNLCENYLDHIQAACAGEKPRDPVTGEEKELDEKLMDAIEQQIDITESGKEDFRNEIIRAVAGALRKKKKFDYTQHADLRVAIQKKLFDERKNVIRMTVSTRNPDTEELKKINDVIKRMETQQNYSPLAANELLKYATAHLFDK